MKKIIGIYTGSFNPPHNGHRNVIIEAQKALNAEIHVVPSAVHFNKGSFDRTSFLSRIDMCNLLTNDLPQVTVSRFRGFHPFVSFWENYYNFLKSVNEDIHPIFIIGSDILQHVLDNQAYHSFNKYSAICLAQHSHAYANGSTVNSISIEDLKSNPGWSYLSIQEDELISSTRLRELLHQEDYENAAKICPENVLDYLKNNKIYTKTRWPLNVINPQF